MKKLLLSALGVLTAVCAYAADAPSDVPIPSHDVGENKVVSLYSTKYTPANTWGFGNWGQTTELINEAELIGDQKTYHISNFNYLGWDNFNPNINVSDCNTLHVDYWTNTGNSFSFTPISPASPQAKERLWVAPTVLQEEWNSYDVPLSYFTDGGVDLTNLFQYKFADGNGSEGYIANVYFWYDPDQKEEEKIMPKDVPTPSQKAEDVLSLYSYAYNQGVLGFWLPAWEGCTTSVKEIEIEGKKIYQLLSFNYQGMDFQGVDLSAYNYIHVDYWTHDGSNFAFTPIGNGELLWRAPEVKKDEWNSYDVPLSYFTPVNFSNIYQFKVESQENNEGYIANIYFYKDENEENPGGDYQTGAVYDGEFHGSFRELYEGNATYDFTVNYTVTYNENKTLTFKGALLWDNGTPVGAIDDMALFINNDQIGIGSRTNMDLTTDSQYSPGQKVTLKLTINAYNGGIVTAEIPYVVGSTSGPSIKITAEAKNITTNSADLAYTLELPDGLSQDKVTITYKKDQEDAVIANSNPIHLEGLTESTQYTYTICASATLDEEPLNAEIQVSFVTDRDMSSATHFYQILNGFTANSYIEGEDQASCRRDLPLSIYTHIIYNPDQTLTVDFTCASKALGLNPQIFIAEGEGLNGNGWINLNNGLVKGDDNHYTYTTTNTYTGELKGLFYYMEFNSGVTRLDISNFNLGENYPEVTYGDPVKPILTANSTEAMIGEPLAFIAYYEDKDGNFLISDDRNLTLTANTADATISGDLITLNKAGKVTLNNTCNGETVSIDFETIVSEDAVNLAKGKIVTIECDGHNFSEEDLKKVTDEDKNSELSLGVNPPEHTVTLDLGLDCNLELVSIVWEGASAKDFDLILKDGQGNIVTEEFRDNPAVGGGLVTNNYSQRVKARYVTIKTYSAANPGWGIKLNQIYAYGTELPQTHVKVGDIKPIEWHKKGVELKGVLETDKPIEDLDIIVSVSTDMNKNEEPTFEESGMPEWLWNQMTAIEIGDNVDGYLKKDPTVELEAITGSANPYIYNIKINADCSGLYKLDITSKSYDIVFEKDEVEYLDFAADVEIYPSTSQTYTYTIDGFNITDSNISINGYEASNDGKIVMKSGEESLKNAHILIPGVYFADIYYAINPNSSDKGNVEDSREDIAEENNPKLVSRRASSAPAGYIRAEGNLIDLTQDGIDSKGETQLSFIVAKNGVFTPEENASTVTVSFDDDMDPTGIEVIGGETADEYVDVYTLTGVRVARGVKAENVVGTLTPGIYIIGGRKVIVK